MPAPLDRNLLLLANVEDVSKIASICIEYFPFSSGCFDCYGYSTNELVEHLNALYFLIMASRIFLQFIYGLLVQVLLHMKLLLDQLLLRLLLSHFLFI